MSWNKSGRIDWLPVNINYGVLSCSHIGFCIEGRSDIEALRKWLSPELAELFLDIWEEMEITMFAGCDGLMSHLQHGDGRYGRPYYYASMKELGRAAAAGRQVLAGNSRLKPGSEIYTLISDELAIIEDEIERKSKAAAKREKRRQPEPGYIYLLHGGGYYKIGRTNDPSRRITEIEPHLPFAVELLHIIPAKDMRDAETCLHKIFADKRAHGEWFELTGEDVTWIMETEEL